MTTTQNDGQNPYGPPSQPYDAGHGYGNGHPYAAGGPSAPPYGIQPPFGGQPMAPYPPMPFSMPVGPPKRKFGGLAVAALVLGIVGVVGSIIPVLNVVSAIAALVGLVLGVVALFGSRKVMSAIGVVLCLLAVVLTVVVNGAFVKAVDETIKQGAVEPGGKSAEVFTFGQTVKFRDGSTLLVEEPVTFTPDRFAITGAKKPVYVKFKATFVNKTGKTYDPSLNTESVSAAGEEGQRVHQSGLDSPANKVLPGKSVSWWIGYGVQSRKDLQLEVSVGFLDYDSVIFTG